MLDRSKKLARAIARRMRPGDDNATPVDAIAQSGAYWDEWSGGAPEGTPDYWMGVPFIRRRINLRMGSESTDHIAQFCDVLDQNDLSPGRMLSVGCGTGGLERNFAGRYPSADIHGIDVSEACLKAARSAAREEGFSIEYSLVDGVSFLRQRDPEQPFDSIFCHGVLHHMQDLEPFLDLARRRLTADGFLFAYEYVGPSRDEWTEEHLTWAQGLFATIPAQYRRIPRVLPTLDLADPTEMIRSSEIENLLHVEFHVEREWRLGGNIVVPLLCALHKDSFRAEPVRSALEAALDIEELLLARGLLRSHYAVYLCRPRS